MNRKVRTDRIRPLTARRTFAAGQEGRNVPVRVASRKERLVRRAVVFRLIRSPRNRAYQTSPVGTTPSCPRKRNRNTTRKTIKTSSRKTKNRTSCCSRQRKRFIEGRDPLREMIGMPCGDGCPIPKYSTAPARMVPESMVIPRVSWYSTRQEEKRGQPALESEVKRELPWKRGTDPAWG